VSERHALVHYGTEKQNWANRHNLTDTFVNRRGQFVDVSKSLAPGIHFCVMDADTGGAIIFRVGEVTLDNGVALEWDRYDWPADNRGVSPNGKRIPDTLAARIIEHAIAENREQLNELGEYRRRIET
jgi:hypothetical protein